MATSTVPALKRALRDRLSVRAGLADVEVVYGFSTSPSTEYIWIGDVEGRQEYAAFQGPLRHETYGVKLIVCVVREGAVSVEDADTRCFAIYAEIENDLQADRTVNGIVKDAQIGPFMLGEYVGTDGLRRESRLFLTVDCEQWF